MQCERNHPSEANNHSAGWKDTVFYVAWPYITLFTTARHWALSEARLS